MDKHANTTKPDKQQTSNNHEEDAKPAPVAATVDKLGTQETEEKTPKVVEELDENVDADALVSSMILETPKMPVNRPPMELSKEMKAALKVLDDNLRYFT